MRADALCTAIPAMPMPSKAACNWLAAGCRDVQGLQRHVAALHVVGGMHIAPLNQRGQAAVKQALAVVAQGDLPLQQATGRHARGFDGGTSVNALRGQRLHCARDVGHTGDPMDQLGAVLCHACANLRVIHIKPACSPRPICISSFLINSN